MLEIGTCIDFAQLRENCVSAFTLVCVPNTFMFFFLSRTYNVKFVQLYHQYEKFNRYIPTYVYG